MSTVERPVSNGRTDSGDGGGSSQPWNPLRGKDGGMFSAFTRRRTDPPAVVVPTRSAETLVPRSSSAGVDGLSDYNAGPPVSDHAQQHGVLKHHASAVLAEASGPTGSGNNSGSNSGNVTDSGSGGGFGKKLTSRLKKEYASAISLNTKRQQQHVDTLLSQGSTDTSLQGPTVRGLPVSNPISFQHVEHLSPTELSVQAKPIAETLVSWPNMSLDADKRASTSRGRKQSAGHIRMLSGSSNARKLSVGHVRNLSVDKALNPLEDDNSRKTLTVRGLPVSDPMEFEHIEHFSPTEYTLKQYQRARPGQQPVQYQHQQPLQPQYQQPIQHQYQQQIQHQYQHQYQHQQHQQHQYQQQQAHPPPQQQQLPPQSQFTQLNVISTPNRANKLGDKAQRVPTVRGLAVGQPMDFRHVEHLSPTDHSILQYQDLNHNQQVKEMVSVATVPNVTSDKMRGGTVRGLPVSGPVSFTHVKHVSQSEYKTQIKKYMETIATQPSASSKGPDQAPTVRGLPVSNPTAFAHVGHFSPADYERQQQQQQQQGHKQQQGQQQGSPPPALTVRGLPVSSPMAFQHIEHYSPSEFASQYRLLREQEPPAPGHAGGSNPPLFGSTSRALPSDSKQHARSPKSATSTMSDRGRQLHRPSSQSQMLSRFKRPSAKASSPDIQAKAGMTKVKEISSPFNVQHDVHISIEDIDDILENMPDTLKAYIGPSKSSPASHRTQDGQDTHRSDSAVSSPRTPIYESMTSSQKGSKEDALSAQISRVSLNDADNLDTASEQNSTSTGRPSSLHQRQPQRPNTPSNTLASKSMRSYQSTPQYRQQQTQQQQQQQQQQQKAHDSNYTYQKQSPYNPSYATPSESPPPAKTPVSAPLPTVLTSQPQSEYYYNKAVAHVEDVYFTPNSPQSASARMYGADYGADSGAVSISESDCAVSRSVDTDKGQWMKRKSLESTHSLSTAARKPQTAALATTATVVNASLDPNGNYSPLLPSSTSVADITPSAPPLPAHLSDEVQDNGAISLPKPEAELPTQQNTAIDSTAPEAAATAMSATAAESTATATAAVADSSKRSKYARSTTVIRTLGSERDLDAAINSSTSVAAAPTPKTQKNPRENYDELEEYAEGESGNVFVAHSKKQNKQVAIKVVSKTAKTRYRKLRNELKILRRIRSHHIVRFYEYFSIDDSVWIVYEFMSRGSLTDLLAGYPVLRMPEPVIAYAMHAILTALAYLHERRIVHCDLRSDNVLIGSNGQVKLADFSSAAHLSTDQKSAQKTALGAVYWMAPELAKGAGYSPSTDVWAAGALIYEMLEGQPPYIEYPELKVLELATAKGIPQPSSPDVWSESVVALMRLCCAANPSERPPASRLRKHEFVESPDTVRSARSLVAFVSEVEQIVEDEQEE